MRRLVIITLAIVLMLPALAGAERLKEGMHELAINADFTSREVDRGINFDLNSIMVEYGVFVSPELEVAGLLDYTDMPDADVKFTTLGAEAKYHIIQTGADTMPYIGGLVGMTFTQVGNQDDTDFSFGFLLGVKHFTSNAASLNGQFKIMQAGDLSVSSLTFGLSIYFLP